MIDYNYLQTRAQGEVEGASHCNAAGPVAGKRKLIIIHSPEQFQGKSEWPFRCHVTFVKEPGCTFSFFLSFCFSSNNHWL
jgi:hypothetical protein